MMKTYTNTDAAVDLLSTQWDEDTAEALVAVHRASARVAVAQERLGYVLMKPFPSPTRPKTAR